MQEAFLHYLWNNGLFSNNPVITTHGVPLEILHRGIHNNDAGPDFFNAKIKIGNTVWAGNVEIHVKSSDWIKHNHTKNPAYQNVILHVVAVNDCPIMNHLNEPIPAIELKSAPGVYEQFLYLMQYKGWIPCESFVSKVTDFTWAAWKDTLLVERLYQKSQLIAERFERNNHHWEETFYQTLAYNFGFKVNSQPFEMLARSLPQQILAKHKDDLQLTEALLFGQSGLLPINTTEEYIQKLGLNYKHLANKFKLKPIASELWKFSKIRPANFPTLRIAQFSALVHQSFSLMSMLLESKSVGEAENYFQLKASNYWNTHYLFGNESKFMEKHLGVENFHNLVINTLAPFLFFYADRHKQTQIAEKAILWLNEIPAEQNQIVSHWQQLGVNCSTALDSQALIQLKNNYCQTRKCLNCRIGNQVIQYRF